MKKRKILIIDDDVPFGKLAQLNLEQTGIFEVDVVSDSTLAEEKALEFKPDLVLLDIVMPGLDGGDIGRIFKDHAYLSSIPIILVSAIVTEEDGSSNGGVVESGGDIMLPKTVKFDVLLKTIDDRLTGVL